jgi:hypothetical protein
VTFPRRAGRSSGGRLPTEAKSWSVIEVPVTRGSRIIGPAKGPRLTSGGKGSGSPLARTLRSKGKPSEAKGVLRVLYLILGPV